MQHISQDINRRAKEVKQERVLRAGAQSQCRYCVDVALRQAHTVHLNSHNPKDFHVLSLDSKQTKSLKIQHTFHLSFTFVTQNQTTSPEPRLNSSAPVYQPTLSALTLLTLSHHIPFQPLDHHLPNSNTTTTAPKTTPPQKMATEILLETSMVPPPSPSPNHPPPH